MRCVLLLLLLIVLPVASRAQGPPLLDVPFEATPQPVVHLMLRLAGVTWRDHVVDLGCGDGRIPIAAAKHFGASGDCIDLDPERVREATEAVALQGVASRVSVRRGDLFEASLDRATVVTLFLWPEMNLRLRPKLLALAPGTRVVSLDHDMGDWVPDRLVMVPHPRLGQTPLFLWVVPAQVSGRWLVADDRGDREIAITQSFQLLQIETSIAGPPGIVTGTGRVTGRAVELSISPTGSPRDAFIGRLGSDGALTGQGWTGRRRP